MNEILTELNSKLEFLKKESENINNIISNFSKNLSKNLGILLNDLNNLILYFISNFLSQFILFCNKYSENYNLLSEPKFKKKFSYIIDYYNKIIILINMIYSSNSNLNYLKNNNNIIN